ncbi:putative retrotransposon protein [Tanacetum coccineum]|uniref:Retrotransposon protein n=1 Tax=Tanacetum coccineum TaxID=301880 RepID=A0ABQ5HDS8_9ASTR
MDGAVHTYKARLVAKGYTQTPGIDYEETFSPVADIRAIRILIAIAAYYDYEIWQMDVKTVPFLMDNSMKRNITSRFQQNPGDLYWTTVKNILKEEAVERRVPSIAFSLLHLQKLSILLLMMLLRKPFGLGNSFLLGLLNESGITKGARHYRAKVHYLREVIEFGDIKLEKVHTDDNLADPFTKALAFPKHSELTRNIGMLPASYVCGTLDYGLELYFSSTSSLVAYSDAHWARCQTSRRSTLGYCVFVGNNLLSWSSVAFSETLGRRVVGLEKGLTAVEGIGAVSALGEATKPKGRSLLAFPVRDASLFVITALKMFSGIREDGALSSALWLFACDKERVN